MQEFLSSCIKRLDMVIQIGITSECGTARDTERVTEYDADTTDCS
jgi:hypothetical protein